MLVITKAKANKMLFEIDGSFILVKYKKGCRSELLEFASVDQAINYIKATKGVKLKTAEITVCEEFNNGNDYKEIALVKVC